MASYVITASFSASGDSDVLDWDGRHKGNFAARGTFGGGTCKLQYSLDDGTNYIDVGSGVTLTAAGNGNFELPTCKIKINFSGGTTPSVTAYVRPVFAG